MRIQDLIAVTKEGVPYTYYPNTFPATAGSDCAIVKLAGGDSGGRAVTRPSFQLLVRAESAAVAESKAWELRDFFHQKQAFGVGMAHVIFVSCQTSSPVYLGLDENGRTVYSLTFQTITEVQ